MIFQFQSWEYWKIEKEIFGWAEPVDYIELIRGTKL
jgi:hypothetical protein